MSEFQLNRRQAVIAGGLGTLSLAMPGAVIGTDQVDASGNAVAAEKSCIFILLCGGPSHVDTWDMKPDAPLDYRGAVPADRHQSARHAHQRDAYAARAGD